MKQDLTAAELDELDGLLAAAPEPLQPLDVISLDGYLAALCVLPQVVPPERWWPAVLDAEGRDLPADLDAAWESRTRTLVMRRFEAIHRGLAEDRVFDPVVADGDLLEPVGEADVVPSSPHSRVVEPWVAGFVHAAETYGGLFEHADEAVQFAMARLLRHLPAEDEDAKALVATMDAEDPLTSEDDAVDQVIAAVADLWDLTEKQRYAVPTVRRDTPKVGRNDPCPCGSGRKYKQCHGQT